MCRLEQWFPTTFLEAPQHCTFCISPLSDTPISGLGVFTNELRIWIRCVWLRRHGKHALLGASRIVVGNHWVRRWRWRKGFLNSPDASRWELRIWNGDVAPCVVPNTCTLWMLSDLGERTGVWRPSGSSVVCVVALLSAEAILGRDKGEKLWNWF